MNKIKSIILFFIVFSIILCGTDGTIRGQVADDEGAPLIGAQIYIPQLGKGTTADVDGNYIMINIPVGEYEVRCQMIGYQTNILTGTTVTMDQTTWLNFALPVSAIEGDVVRVSSQKRLVEKGTTSKKITVNQEAIETLPIKDVSDLYNLQSGVVKVESKAAGIPDHSERGLEEVHVRGGRSGEIAYMIDGMYIRNPIFGGIGNGTRLNKFAIREFDWQPGGFNAEYGDAMSAVSNLHTMTGGSDFSYKFQYETSLLGSALGSRYDELRDYHDYNIGLGGTLPFNDDIKIWASAQSTSSGNFSLYKFDDFVYSGQYPEDNTFALELMLYQQNDPEGFETDRYNYTWPWDNVSGYRGFGFDNTVDYFGKLGWDLSSQLKLTFSYWNVEAHRKSFNSDFIYWDDGRQELFRDTERHALEINHTISQKSFYTIRASRFVQDQFIGVRHADSDNDGYPDWFEWRYPAGFSQWSDPYNEQITPYHLDNEELIPLIDQRDGNGPEDFTSGWYYGMTPGNYNWNIAEDFIDANENGLCDFCPGTDSYGQGQSEFNLENDINSNGIWDGPVLLEEAIYRDGDYWLTPEMYINSEPFDDVDGGWLVHEGLSPTQTTEPFNAQLTYFAAATPGEDPAPLYFVNWNEEKIFGGSDEFYSTSTAETHEIRFDFTSQITNRWRTRFGVDYKTHRLNFYEIKKPWEGSSANRQRFAERWDDYGVDRTEWVESPCSQPDLGEGNGVWDAPGFYTNPCNDQLEYFPGEIYDDFNEDGKWNDYVEPEEFAAYFQNTYEVPWMVVNVGVRLDAVQYNTKIWADANGNFSPYNPNFYFDCGSDINITTGEAMCPGDSYVLSSGFNVSGSGSEANSSIGVNVVVRDNEFYAGYEVDPETGEYVIAGYDPDNGNPLYDTTELAELIDQVYCQDCSSTQLQQMLQDSLIISMSNLDEMTGNDIWDEGELTTDNISETTPDSKVIFKPSKWLYKVSPRLGISHVISDGATFTFNYGLYYQTPIYEFIYRNVSKLEDPGSAFEDAGNSGSSIGNATMTAGRTQSYELAFNMEITREWAFTAGVWVKDMDQLTTAAQYSSGVYEFKVAKNGDFGTAIGFDFTVENRGSMFNTTVQYTYSTAKASSEYDAAAFGTVEVDAPKQETLMPYDRTHDLTLSLYSTKLPFGFNGGITAFFQSGQPYTGVRWSGDKPEEDLLNKYGKRAPNLVTMDLSLSKEVQLRDHRLMLGMNVYNLFDKPYTIDIYPITGNADKPGEYYEKNIARNISGSFYDRPWMYSSNREINFFIRIDFK